MKFNKKLFSLLFVALLALVLVGCGGEGTTTEAPTDAPTTEAPTTETPTTETPTTLPVDFQPALDYLETEYADTLLNDNFVATEDLTLVNSYEEFTFTWSSNNTDILANDGTISRPLMSEGDQTAILTVTISHGEETATQDFFVTVKALEEKTAAEIAEEVFLFVFAIPSQEFWTSADTLNLVDNGEDNDGNLYPVTWATSHPEYITTEGVITQPDGQDVDVTLTATITVDSIDFTEERVFTVAQMAEGTEVSTIEAAIDMGQDAYVEILGVTVIAMYDSGDVFFTDGTDILYIYSPPFDAVVGEVYDITGSIDFYYNAPQLAGSDTHPLRAVASDAAVTSAPVVGNVTVSDIVTATSVPSSENPHEYVQYEVTASVYYEESWGNYSLFLVPTTYDFDAALASGATQPNGDAIMIYYRSDMDVLESFHGEEITITIVMQGYRTDKSVFYANFFGTAEDVQLSFSNDADAIDAALGLVEFPYSVVETTTFDLVTDIYGVSIVYSTDNATVFDTTTGTIDVSSLTAQETIAVTATATKGTETSTKTISIKVGPLPTSDISAVLDLPNSDLAKIEGTVVAGGYYRLFFIQDGTDNIALYVSDSDMIALLEANVGNVVTVTGSKSTYNGLHQLNASEVVYVSDGTAPAPTNIDGITLDEAGLLAHQGELVVLTGMVITDVYIDNYGNYQFTLERISDGEEIKLRWDSRYDLPTALDTEMKALEVGDKVTVTTVLSWFRGPQLALVTTTDFTVETLTDADKVALDARNMESELTLSGDYVLEDGEYGSTISVVEIFGNAANFMDTTTTTGTWLVTQPYDTDVTAIVTFKVMSGTVEQMVEVEVTISSMLMPQTPSELFISEYGEGSSNNKWVEIYNGTGADVDLSTYSIELYSNGATTATQTLDLTGTLAAGDVYVIYNPNLASDSTIVENGDIDSQITYYNGDDALALLKDNVVIDVIGVIGVDPDSGSWEAGDGSTAEYTLVRSQSTFAPNTTFTASEWIAYEQDTFDYIGSHTLVTGETTDAMIVNADLAAIDLGGVIKAAQTVNLPTIGDNGSTITWTILEDLDANATMNATNDAVTFTEAPADTVEVVKLEATVTMNTETMTGVFVYKIEGVTDADRVAGDKAEVEALDLGGEAYAEVSVSLPTTGTNGSTITWAVTTDDDNLATYVSPDLTIDRADGTDSIVTLTATITSGSVSDTVVITYTMKAEVTTLSELHAMTDGTNYDYPDGTVLYVEGVVSSTIYQSFFIQDSLGNGIYVDTDLAVNEGDHVLLKVTITSNNGVRLLENATITNTITTGVTIIYNELTADELINLDASDAGKLIKFTGLEVVSYPSGWPYTASFKVNGTTDSIILSMDSFNFSNVDWFEGVFAVGDTLPEVTFVFFDFGFGKNRIEALNTEFTDAYKLEYDVNKLPDSLTLTDDYVLPTPEYGTYTVTTVSTELDAYIDETTTPGTLLITRPAIGQPNVSGTVVVRVEFGTETPVDVTINVTILAEAVYETGFESSEGFTAGTTYNNTTEKVDGEVGFQWATYYGTASTTGEIDGDQSMQMRWYTSAPENLGYTYTQFTLTDISEINFTANSQNGLNVTVSISIDGGTTWIEAELFTLTGTATDFVYNIDAAYQTENIQVMFEITLPDTTPTSNSRITIDNIVVF